MLIKGRENISLRVTCQIGVANLIRLLSGMEVHGHWTQSEQSISLQDV